LGQQKIENSSLPPGVPDIEERRLNYLTIIFQRNKMPKMPRPRHNTTALPRDLRSELGIRDVYGDKKRRLNGPASRKERRQNERTQKKSRHAAPPNKKTFEHPQQRSQQKPQKRAQDDSDVDIEDEDLDLNSDDMDLDEGPSDPQTKSKSVKEAAKEPKSILKKPAVPQDSESESEAESEFGSEIDLDEDEDEDEVDESDDESEDNAYEAEPKKTEAHIPGSVKAKLAQDDAEIAELEKRLGLKKGGKLPKAFEEDGLDELLGDLAGGGDASEDESKKRKREADDWLRNKRLKAKSLQAQQLKKDDSEMDSDEDFDLDEEIFGGDDSDEAAEGSDFDGFDEEEPKEPKKKENPYIAPVTKPEPTAQKYIPPSLRARSDPESESLTRLKRQAQGHLNKLSEANMLSIVAEFEKLYRDYPRQHVTSTLVSLLMGLICERAALQDTFLILHAGFIAALYKLMGMDVGAEIIQTVVETLDAGGDEHGSFQGKEATNLVSLLSQLYNFHVIGSSLMFDYVRLYVQDITESNTELLLKVIRSK
jgi:nucleolar MIF4G domain-containing protein 1